jgi:hypothetical protein
MSSLRKCVFKGGLAGYSGDSGRNPISSCSAEEYFWAQVQLVDVLSGAANTGDQLDVFIATRPTAERYIWPATPTMRAREYFVVIFLNAESEHQLLGLPASREEYERWEAGFSENLH